MDKPTDYREQIQQEILELEKGTTGPKTWTACTFDERFEYLELLHQLYRDCGLPEAKSD
jgi:hypothetical protein